MVEADTRTDPVEAFARAFVPLSYAWGFWLVPGSLVWLGPFAPLGWITAAITLYWLERLAGAATGAAARSIRRAIAVGIVAALVMYVGPILQSDPEGPASAVAGFALVAVAGAVFTRGMQRWLAEWDTRRVLQTWWRRLEKVAWAAAAVLLLYVARAAWLAGTGRPSAEAPDGTVGEILAGLALAVSLTAVAGVWITGDATREALEKYLKG